MCTTCKVKEKKRPALLKTQKKGEKHKNKDQCY